MRSDQSVPSSCQASAIVVHWHEISTFSVSQMSRYRSTLKHGGREWKERSQKLVLEQKVRTSDLNNVSICEGVGTGSNAV